MSKTLRTFIATGFAAATLAVPTAAFADRGGDSNPDNWGDQLRQCRTTTACADYGPGENKNFANRGGYVSSQAKDSDTEGVKQGGYGEEMQGRETDIGNQRNGK